MVYSAYFNDGYSYLQALLQITSDLSDGFLCMGAHEG